MHHPPLPFIGACAPNAGDFRIMAGQISTAQWKSVKFSGYLTTRPNLHANWTWRGDLTLPVLIYFLFCVSFVHVGGQPSCYLLTCLCSWSCLYVLLVVRYEKKNCLIQLFHVYIWFAFWYGKKKLVNWVISCLYLVCVLIWEKQNRMVLLLCFVHRKGLVELFPVYIWVLVFWYGEKCIPGILLIVEIFHVYRIWFVFDVGNKTG